MSQYDFFLDNIKSNFIQWLMQNNFYSTLALLAQCKVNIRDDIPTAQIACRYNQPPVISIGRALAEVSSQKVLNMILFHEIRHIIQIAFNTNVHQCITYPDWCKTDDEKKLAYRLISNRAMDVALHEDFRPLFGDNFHETFNAALRESYKRQILAEKGEEPSEEEMSQISIQIAKPEWDKNKDFIYYAQKILDEIEQDAQKGRGASQPQNGFDEHDFGEDSGNQEDGDDAGENATHSWLRKLVKRAAEEGKIMCKHAGAGHGDSEMFLGKATLNQQIIDFVNKIKIKANRIAQGQTSQRYTYGRMNKLWPDMGLPGKTKTTEYTEGCFFIADVSGSMWSPELLNQLLPVLEILQKRKAIAGAYACDVKLTPFGNKITGGGGTELGSEQVLELCKMHNLKPNAKIDIVYATDGYVDLTEIEKMDNVSLHVVIIENENLKSA